MENIVRINSIHRNMIMKQCLIQNNALCEISTWYLFNKISEKNAFYLFSKRFIDFFFNVFLVNKNEIFYISTTFEEKKKSIYPSIKLVLFAQVYLHNRAFTLYGRTKSVCYIEKRTRRARRYYSLFSRFQQRRHVNVWNKFFLIFIFLFFRASFVCARFFNALGIYFANSQSYNTIFFLY